MDCLKASEMCNQNAQCSSRFRIMRQCLVGRDRSAMLENKECQVALEVLQDSPLHHCHCKRGMKKELQCLQSYWTIHMSLNEGEEHYETSPYEPMHFSDEFRLASIISECCFISPNRTVLHPEIEAALAAVSGHRKLLEGGWGFTVTESPTPPDPNHFPAHPQLPEF
ncbi:GDNF family receptor alpha-2 [Bagarius yarrelli]|uniref:GDNF family receptor alpha-2 n=1 Tax=Bagarius yarrelli TaxID=175774 RepID=A0A556U2S2_BAGYA|nr:GDNF family receptor alpha-2 [Bagarius yarrelli]